MISLGGSRSAQTLSVYRAEHFRVVNGANLGDPVSIAEELELNDLYRLSPVAGELPLTVIARPDGPFLVAARSEVGRAGAEVHLDCALTLMAGTGETTEAIVLVETDAGATSPPPTCCRWRRSARGRITRWWGWTPKAHLRPSRSSPASPSPAAR